MTAYEETVKSLSETKTLASHIKGLGKIKISTEDASLIKALEALLIQLQADHSNKRIKNKSTPISIEKSNIREVNVLLAYCNKAIVTKKPEWQILAERNNWKPS